MKAILLFFAILAAAASFGQQSHKGKSGLAVKNTVTQSVFGASMGYYVEFKNNSGKTIDGIKWKATFTNNFGEVMGVRDGMWQSGNILSPIGPGESTEDLENVFVKGATQIWITVTEVHFKK
jgi:hypothetical protein